MTANAHAHIHTHFDFHTGAACIPVVCLCVKWEVEEGGVTKY